MTDKNYLQPPPPYFCQSLNSVQINKKITEFDKYHLFALFSGANNTTLHPGNFALDLIN